MDGASKFVRGDAIAAVLIMLTNTSAASSSVSGRRDAPRRRACQLYPPDIGEGLVAQIRR
jgi:flagellar biosynthesis component FlhA